MPTEFQTNSNVFESALDADFKQNHGIFYTDVELSSNIVRFLNIPQGSSIIDPCCGTGSFLHSLQDVGQKEIYGCDFDDSTVKRCQELTNCPNVFCVDTLGNSGECTLSQIKHDRFDYVVGNPPYAPIAANVELNADQEFQNRVARSGNNLYVAAIYRAFELCKEDGVISVIIPKSLLHVKSYSSIRKHILENKTIISIVELGIHFKAVRGEQIILTIRNCQTPGNEIHFYSYSGGQFEPLATTSQSFFEDEIIVFTNNEEPQIYTKLKSGFHTLGSFNICKIARGRERGDDVIRGKEIRKYGFKEIAIPADGSQLFIQNIYTAEAGITATYAGNLKAGETITVVTATDKEICKYILGILHSRVCNYYLVRFAFNNSRLTMHADGKYLNTIPFVLDTKRKTELIGIVSELEQCEYLSPEWFGLNDRLNLVVYKIFGFDKEEIKYLEKEMRTISSAKWYLDGKARTRYY